jgi:hypothetical protein
VNLLRLRDALRRSSPKLRDVRGPVRVVGGGWRFIDPATLPPDKDHAPGIQQVPATLTAESRLPPR